MKNTGAPMAQTPPMRNSQWATEKRPVGAADPASWCFHTPASSKSLKIPVCCFGKSPAAFLAVFIAGVVFLNVLLLHRVEIMSANEAPRGFIGAVGSVGLSSIPLPRFPAKIGGMDSSEVSLRAGTSNVASPIDGRGKKSEDALTAGRSSAAGPSYSGGRPLPSRLTRWPNPTLVVGLPKAGTTSIAAYFHCGNNSTLLGREEFSPPLLVSHYFCPMGKDRGYGKNGGRVCGNVIRHNLQISDPPKPPLSGTGRYDVYTQLDVNLIKGKNKSDVCFFPQVEALDALHAHYPDSTFILNTRNVTDWIRSVRSWSSMDRRMATTCNFTGLMPQRPIGRRGKPSDEELEGLFLGHMERVREFVRDHPSHAFVEVAVDSEDAGRVMEENFGISRRCWGQENSRSQKEKTEE